MPRRLLKPIPFANIPEATGPTNPPTSIDTPPAPPPAHVFWCTLNARLDRIAAKQRETHALCLSGFANAFVEPPLTELLRAPALAARLASTAAP